MQSLAAVKAIVLDSFTNTIKFNWIKTAYLSLSVYQYMVKQVQIQSNNFWNKIYPEATIDDKTPVLWHLVL